jgi:hypothetical protein
MSINKIVILPGNGCRNIERANWYATVRDELRKRLSASAGVAGTRAVSAPYEFGAINATASGGGFRFHVDGNANLVRHLSCGSLVWASAGSVVRIRFGAPFNASLNNDRRIADGVYNISLSPLIRARQEVQLSDCLRPNLELEGAGAEWPLLAYGFALAIDQVSLWFTIGTKPTTTTITLTTLVSAIAQTSSLESSTGATFSSTNLPTAPSLLSEATVTTATTLVPVSTLKLGDNSAAIIGGAVGASVGLLVIAFVMLAVWYRRRDTLPAAPVQTQRAQPAAATAHQQYGPSPVFSQNQYGPAPPNSVYAASVADFKFQTSESPYTELTDFENN